MNVAVVNEESNRDSLLMIYEKELIRLKQELELKNEMLNNYISLESVGSINQNENQSILNNSKKEKVEFF